MANCANSGQSIKQDLTVDVDEVLATVTRTMIGLRGCFHLPSGVRRGDELGQQATDRHELLAQVRAVIDCPLSIAVGMSEQHREPGSPIDVGLESVMDRVAERVEVVVGPDLDPSTSSSVSSDANTYR